MPRDRKKSQRSRPPVTGEERLRKRLLQGALKRPLAEVMALFGEVTMGVPAPDELYAWEFFAHYTMRRARRARKTRNKNMLAWSSMGFRVFDQLATCPSTMNWSSRKAAQYGAHFRGLMTSLLVSRAGEPVFEPEAVFDWFQGSVSISSEEAVQRVSMGLGNLSSTTHSLLRRLWCHLGRMSRLPGMRELMRRHPEMKGWLRFMNDFRRANEDLYVYRVFEGLIQLRRAKPDHSRDVSDRLE